MSLKLLTTLWSVISPDRHPEREKAREREFIRAANSLKTLKVTPEGGMSIDPEELREQIFSAREQLKHLVQKPGAASTPFNAAEAVQVEQEASPALKAPVSALDCVEVVAWRRLPSGAAVRYTCLQCLSTCRFVVVAASLFSGRNESLPPWIEGNTNGHVASAFETSELHWCTSMVEAMDAWDAEL